jgi:TonB-linked SusC/RagA family outer membrane protein
MKKNSSIRGLIPLIWNKKCLRIMRLTFLFIFVSLMQVSASLYSQSTKLSLNFQNARVVDVLEAIENQSEFRFAYSAKYIDMNRKVNVEVKGKSIEQTLSILFEGAGVTYSINDRHIMLFRADMEPNSTQQQQSKSVSGKVTDSSGATVPGVSVVLKGTTTGTITDNNGNYSLSNISENATLQFSFVGMKMQEIVVAGKSSINVVLVEDAIGIEEVVAVGYGTGKKKDLSGSVASVKAEQIKNIPVTTMEQALVGRASGVQVIQGGAPGDGATVRIRGISTTGNNDPLWVVDGLAIGGSYNLNPSDIETIDILKDASATAIYGSRAANGVIIVTTKRGKEGKTKVEFDSYYGVQQTWKQLNLLNGPEFATLANEAYTNSSLPLNPVWANPESLSTTNWQNTIFQKGAIQNYNLSISGGTQKLKAALSLNYNNTEGTVITSKFERYSIRLNTDYEVSKRLRFGSNLQFSRNSTIGVSTNDMSNGLINIAVQMQPSRPIYNPDGSYNVLLWPETGIYSPWQVSNPIVRAHSVNNKNFGQRFTSSFFGELEIIGGLKFKSTIGINVTNTSTRDFTPLYITDPVNVQNNSFNSLYWSMGEGLSYTAINTLTYGKILGKHNFTALIGSEAINGKYYNMNTNAQNTPSNEIQVLDAAFSNKGMGNGSENAFVSYFGRINYIFNDKYIVQLNTRADGSYKFDPEHRWGYFPSGSVAWRMTNEEFMKPITFLNDLKLRASYGASGNQNSVSDFAYMSRYSMHAIGYSLGLGDQAKAPASVLSNMGNPKLKWETQVMTDIGFDASLWENSISIVFDYYNKITNGLLVPIPVPSTLGAPDNVLVQNAGKIKNSGLELALSYNGNVREFKYGIGANITTVKNEILSLGAGQPIMNNIDLVGGNAINTRTEVGHSIGEYYGLITNGIYQKASEILPSEIINGAKPGDRKYIDINKDGFIDGNDRTFIGSPIPKFFYGFNLNASFKGFDLTILFQGQQGNKNLNILKGQLYNLRNFNGAGVGNVSRDLLNSWRGEGTSNTLTRIAYNPYWTNYAGSDFYVEDGSFFRCRSMQIGYTLPVSLANRVNLSSIRFYVNAQNLFTVTKYGGFDPEISNSNALSTGVDQGQYPVARSFTLGVNLQF